jgi:hypothetical protein
MPPPAANEPVNRNPINIIEKNPATCHVTALVNNLIVLSIGCILLKPVTIHGAIVDARAWTLCEFAA